ncbi:MAG TPA: hypothetical protein V6D30_15835 [Leptolyngbyaceae cyanobacterium]|jgi:hypothetical protein
MIISDLEYLEVVGEENRVEGGVASVSGAVASASASGTNQASFSVSTTSFTSLTEITFPFPFPFLPRNFPYSFSSASSRAFAS